MKPSWHYYEAHISVLNEATVYPKRLKSVLDKIGFHLTDIVTVPLEGLEQEEFDYILTSKGNKLKGFTEQVKNAVTMLKNSGYTVLRYKIESTILDSKYEDKLELL